MRYRTLLLILIIVSVITILPILYVNFFYVFFIPDDVIILKCIDMLSVVESSTMFDLKTPRYMPEGYKFNCAYVDSYNVQLFYSGSSDEIHIYAEYILDNNITRIYESMMDNTNNLRSISIDGKEAIISNSCYSCPHYIARNNAFYGEITKPIHSIFYDDNIRYEIVGIIQEDELIKVARSLK